MTVIFSYIKWTRVFEIGQNIQRGFDVLSMTAQKFHNNTFFPFFINIICFEKLIYSVFLNINL